MMCCAFKDCMRTKKNFLLLPLFFFFYTGICQEGALQFYQSGFYVKQYSEFSGLVSNGCRRPFEDSRGMLWIYTFKGLSRFDGRQFVNFGTNEGLPSPNITQVCEDSLGYIYVATTKGIARYTGYNKTNGSYFYVYPQTKDIKGPIGGFQAIDSNTILFQADRGAVFLLHNGKLREVGAPSKDGQRGETMHHSKYQYYYCYITDTLRVFDYRFNNIANIYHKDSGHTGQEVDDAGDFHLYHKGVKRKLAGKDIVYTSAVPDSIVWFASLDTMDKMVYFRTGNIYYYADGKSVKILDLQNLSLICNSITATRDGSVWIATNGGGMFRITPLCYKDISVTGNHFRYQDKKKVIIKNGLLNNELNIQTELERLGSITQSVLLDRNNITWFCTQQGIYKKEKGKQPVLYTFPGKSNFWNENATKVMDAIESADGDIWFYGYCGVIHYRDGEFKQYDEKSGLIGPAIRIRNLEVDTEGSVFLTDHYGRLLYIQGDTMLPLKIIGQEGLSTDNMRADSKGHLWVEYNKKLYKIRKQSPGNYVIADSIIQDPLIAVTEVKTFNFDRQGNCWVGYTGGKVQVFFIDASSQYSYKRSIIYTMDNGLAPITASHYNFYPDEEGNMAIIPNRKGGGKIFLFSAKDVLARRNIQGPKVSLTEILINHEHTDWTSMNYTTGPTGIPSSCKLRYANNNVIFNYTGASLSDPGSVIYQTMLKGYDDKWQTTTATMANYTNLPPGRYTFLLKTANANGIWSEAHEYRFIISPPWYKTWWATVLWILVCGSILLFFFYLRVNSIRMSNLKENNMFKSSLIGLIGHDMMTPLRYIAKVSSQLKMYNSKLSRETTLDSLGDINVTASRLQFFGESILHWINLQNTEFSPAMERFYVNKTITDLVEFHQLLAVEKDNSINHEIPNELFCYQDPTLVKIILHNLLLNANKFTTNGKIKVSAILEDDWLVIKVTDTGKGMDQTKVNSLNQFQPIISSPGTLKEKGWGMGYKMIMDLLKFSKGTLHVKSKLNEGTEVTIRLFSGKKEYSQRLKVIYNN